MKKLLTALFVVIGLGTSVEMINLSLPSTNVAAPVFIHAPMAMADSGNCSGC
jgi:hypothetical protein